MESTVNTVHPARGLTPTTNRKGLWLLVFQVRTAVIELGGCTK
jgi:hypothetical protein